MKKLFSFKSSSPTNTSNLPTITPPPLAKGSSPTIKPTSREISGHSAVFSEAGAHQSHLPPPGQLPPGGPPSEQVSLCNQKKIILPTLFDCGGCFSNLDLEFKSDDVSNQHLHVSPTPMLQKWIVGKQYPIVPGELYYMAIRSEEKLTELMEWQVLCSFIESKGQLLCLFIDVEGISN